MKVFIYGLTLKAKERVLDTLGKRVFDDCQIDPQTLLFNVTLNENVIFKSCVQGIVLDLGGKIEIVNCNELEIVKIK